MPPEKFKSTWRGWARSSDGYAVRLMGRTSLQCALWLASVVDELWESGGSQPWQVDAVAYGYLSGAGLILLACWLWAFMWPRFLV
jgi:hypothetical protein